MAQQMIFNVPSHDILEPGRTVGEAYASIPGDSAGRFNLTARLIRGIGGNVEMGFGVMNLGFTADHHESLFLALKRMDTISTNPDYTLSEGFTGSSPLQGGDQSGLLLYVTAARKLDSNIRLTLGLFAGLGGITGESGTGGIVAGVEYHLYSWLCIQGDYLSGSSALGYISIGAVLSLDYGIDVLAALERATAGRAGDRLSAGAKYHF